MVDPRQPHGPGAGVRAPLRANGAVPRSGVAPFPDSQGPPRITSFEKPVQRIGAVGLLLLLFCSFSRVTDFAGSNLHIPLVLSIFCLVMALLSGDLLVALKSPIGIALTGFTFWFVCDIPTSFWRSDSLALLTDSWSKCLGLFVVTGALLASLRQIKAALRTLGYAFLVTSALGFVFGRTNAVDGRFSLSQGEYGGANELATAMVQGCIFWWYMMHSSSRSAIMRWLSVLPMIPLLIILLKTGSRAGIVVIGVTMVMIFFHYSMKNRIVFLLVVLIGVGAAVLAPNEAGKRFSTILKSDVSSVAEESALASSTQRGYLLKRSLELTLAHPIFGVGPGQFAVAEAGMSATEGKRGQWLGTHNTYTQISSECGLPGLFFFVASLWFCWKELRAAERIHRDNPSPDSEEYLTIAFVLRLALVSFAVFFCFEHVGYDAFYPALAGIIAAFAHASRKFAPQAVSPMPARLAQSFPRAGRLQMT